jgi:hypothetical protein
MLGCAEGVFLGTPNMGLYAKQSTTGIYQYMANTSHHSLYNKPNPKKQSSDLVPRRAVTFRLGKSKTFVLIV